MPHLLYLKGEETVKCAYCGKAIRQADQKQSVYIIGMGHMHPACRDTYRANQLDALIREA